MPLNLPNPKFNLFSWGIINSSLFKTWLLIWSFDFLSKKTSAASSLDTDEFQAAAKMIIKSQRQLFLYMLCTMSTPLK